MMTKGQAADMAAQAVAEYESQIGEYSQRHQSVTESMARNSGKLRETCDRLAHGLIRAVDVEAIDRVASETGCLDLPAKLEQLFAERQKAEQQKSEIEATAEFQNREILLHPQVGEFSEKISEHESLVTSFEQELDRFELPEFRWLYARGVHEPKQDNAFQSFLRAVTLADHREHRALEITRQTLGDQPFAKIVEDFKRAETSLSFHRQELEAWQAKHRKLADAVKHHGELQDWLAQFDTTAIDYLRKSLSNHLQQTDFDLLHQSIRREGRILAAQCHALQKKVVYFEDMRRFLEREMEDRKERCRSIRNVQAKWRAQPYHPVSGDKSNWLKTVPHKKRQSTSKQVAWVDTMHHNVDAYEDYDQYDVLLESSAAFLAYDAFAVSADERMPYEGFSRTVIDELDSFRVDHDMERADYGELRSLILQGEAEESAVEDSQVWEETNGDGGDDADAAAAAIATVALLEAQDEIADSLGAEES